MYKLKCADCGEMFEVDVEVFNRYMYEGDDYQCEKCFYEVRDNIFSVNPLI